jgi:hypothetical protein
MADSNVDPLRAAVIMKKRVLASIVRIRTARVSSHSAHSNVLIRRYGRALPAYDKQRKKCASLRFMQLDGATAHAGLTATSRSAILPPNGLLPPQDMAETHPGKRLIGSAPHTHLWQTFEVEQ